MVDIDDFCDAYVSFQKPSNAVIPDRSPIMPPSNLPLVPAMSNNILQPVDASKDSIVNKKNDDKVQRNTSKWAEFELDNSSPFELVELQSINDMDALATVLIPDSANARSMQSSSHDNNTPKITNNNTTTSSQSDDTIWSSQYGNNGISEMNTSQYDDIVVLSVTENTNSISTDTISASNITCKPGNHQNSYEHPASNITNTNNLYNERQNLLGNHRSSQSYQLSGTDTQRSMELPRSNNLSNERLLQFSNSSSNSTISIDSNKVYPPKRRGLTLIKETGSTTAGIGPLNMEPLQVIDQLLFTNY